MADEITLNKGTWAQIRDYFGEVRTEMKRVTWPGKQETYGMTVLVIATTFAFGLFFLITDHLFYALVHDLLKFLMHRA
ncbi:MAG: preprotein translocase subunit SecE [Terriglobia bacterium]